MHQIRTLLLATSALLPLGIAIAIANPQGAQVVGGSATVQGQGTPTVTVTQTTDKAIINWNTFNIGAGEKTNIFQPSSSSIQLDRVTGGLGPSQILGSLWSNGRVFLVNPDGILFGAGSKVDTAGLLATTHDIGNADFMAGKYNFLVPGNPNASIVNQGSITAQSGGFGALVAPGVRNSGTITATLGTVALGSGSSFTLDFYGDKLITLGVNSSVASTVKDVATGQSLNSLVSNSGKLSANGGRVELTAGAARQVVDSVINNTGVLEANSIGSKNGMIVLSAATASSKPVGSPTQNIKISGTLSSAGNTAATKGGTIQVTGENIAATGATIDASGTAGGGNVNIGGGRQGQGPLQHADTVTIDRNSAIRADAAATGNGGNVVVWSDQLTTFGGTITARGGAQSGNGGEAEVSGKAKLAYTGFTDLSAPYGKFGTLLLDPHNVTISTGTDANYDVSFAANADNSIINTTTLVSALNAASVTVSTGLGGAQPGDITVANAINWGSANTLTLSAYHSIALNAAITASGTSAGLVLNTNVGGSGGLLTFGPNGSASFTGTPTGGQTLFINNTSYTLLYSMAAVQNINNNLSGTFALAKPLNATGFSNWAPIGSSFGANFFGTFTGRLEGLGNTIANLSIAPTQSGIDKIGLFGIIGVGGVVQDLRLSNFNIQANPNLGTGLGVGFQSIGTLAGYNAGSIIAVTSNGGVINGGTATGVVAGGLVGQNGFFDGSTIGGPTVYGGMIQHSHSAVTVTLGDSVGCSGNSCNNSRTNLAGGLVGINPGTIGNSSASGNVVVGADSQAGGLAGVNQTPFGATTFPQPMIVNSFATGNVTSNGVNVSLGGLVGYNSGSVLTGHPGGLIVSSYATGAVTANANLTANAGLDCSVAFCQYESAGGLVGQNSGTISSLTTSIPTPSLTSCGTGWSCASGAVGVGSNGQGGGLVGYNDGIIQYAYATTGAVTGAAGLSNSNSANNDHSTRLGGLVGANQGLIQFSYAAGAVGTLGVADLQAGGLVSDNGGAILNSYATGNVRAGDNSQAGGLTGNIGPWDNSCIGCNPGDGYLSSNAALIDGSYATGNVTVGAGSLAGGLSASIGGKNMNPPIIYGRIINSAASGAVSGGGNSILGGLVGVADIYTKITNSTATGTVTSTDTNSWLGGFVGVNGGLIQSLPAAPAPPVTSASGSVTGTSASVLGGFVAMNFGTITDSTTTSSVTVSGANNYAGGFVGANFGWIDPSTAAGNVTGGASNVLGSFAGGNITLAGYSAGSIPGSTTFPVGTISAGSVGSGTVNGTTGVQTGTTNPTFFPAAPSIVASCDSSGLCSILTSFLALPTTDPLPSPPAPDTWVNLPDNTVNTPPPILASLTPPSAPAAPPATGTGSYANATPGTPTFIPPPWSSRAVMGPNGETRSFIPPVGETRLVNNQLILQFGNLSDAEIGSLAQSLGLRVLATETVLGRRLFTVQIPNGRNLRDIIATLDKNANVSAAPIYKFTLSQGALAASKGDPGQYLLSKLQLQQAHAVATGKGVTIALIDSQVDKRHVELQGTISEELDTVGVIEPLQSHGTEMAGAIVSHNRLLGVAPDAKILAVRAFGQSAATVEATTLSILKGIEWAETQGARIINMSFAGPRDPSLERALKAAHDKGIVLIAAAGNAGPKSPPLYPGADANVIAVTATDANNRLFRGANQGPQLSVAAPGVDILAPVPAGGYQMSTGTSIATAHVSGVVALMLERDPTLKPDNVRKILESTATGLGPQGKNGQFGWGLVNPPKALEAVAAQMKPSDASSKSR